jgi:teichuronic acid biosynthesis glycosyltransferase TuaC
MRVLTVCSGKKQSSVSFENSHPFISEQINALKARGVEFDVFLIENKGVKGYLIALKHLNNRIRGGNYDLIHAHYGFSGMLSVLQFRLPVVISFLGCDINVLWERLISTFAMQFSAHNIFVSKDLFNKAFCNKRSSVLSYGVDFDTMFPVDKTKARDKLGFDISQKICLFGSKKTRYEKNFPLAERAVNKLKGVHLLDIKGGYSKDEINLLINAADVLLLTSYREGSPQIIKEAMACNTPIVTTNVGDVKDVIGETEGCFISDNNPESVAANIKKALKFSCRTNGRDAIKHFDNNIIADKILNIYKNIIYN